MLKILICNPVDHANIFTAVRYKVSESASKQLSSVQCIGSTNNIFRQ